MKFMFGLQHPLTCKPLNNPFEPFAIKWEVNIFLKKSSCVFLPASYPSCVLSSCIFVLASVLILYHCDAEWWCRWLYNSTIYMHWVPTRQSVNKEYYVEVLREFRKRFHRKRPVLFKLDQWHFHKDNAPVYNSILVTDYLTKMGIKTVPQPPNSPDLAPCDFCLFPKLRGCRYETIEEMKEAVTKVIYTLTQEDFDGAFEKLLKRYNALQLEEITSKGTRVLYVYYQ